MQHMGNHEAMKRSGDRGGRWDLSADQAKEKRLLVSSLYSVGDTYCSDLYDYRALLLLPNRTRLFSRVTGFVLYSTCPLPLSRIVDFTKPYLSTGVTFLYKPPSIPTSSWDRQLLGVFAIELWLLVGASFIITAIALMFLQVGRDGGYGLIVVVVVVVATK